MSLFDLSYIMHLPQLSYIAHLSYLAHLPRLSYQFNMFAYLSYLTEHGALQRRALEPMLS